MKNFNNYQDFAIFTIRENLHIAKYCIDTPKRQNTNSCYGMSALILLSSVIDTIGMFYCRNGNFTSITKQDVANNTLGKTQQHFDKFYDKFLTNHCDKNVFMDKFYHLARCRATHNNVLGDKIRITINALKKDVVFMEKRNVFHINLNALYEIVNNAFKTLLRESKSQVFLNEEQFSPTTGGTTTR